MQLTKKIKIHPTEEQVDVLWKLSEQCRLVYNFALAERKETWKKERRSVKYIEQQNKLPELKRQYPAYNIVYSKVLQSVLKKLDANYKSFFSLRKNGDKSARPPNFRNRKYFMTLVYNQSGFRIDGNTIIFSHKVNDVCLLFNVQSILDSSRIKQIEIYNDDPYKAKGDFFISITCDVSPSIHYVDNNQYQAIDLGITKIVTAVNTQGKFFETKTPRSDQYWNAKIDSIKSRRDHCKKGSKRWNRLHNTYRKMEAKKSHQIKDFQHNLSKKMIENTKANTIIVGDLNVKSMAQSKKATGKKKRSINRSTQNQGYLSRFIGFLTYKAELRGKKVIRIDESYTSKACHSCGKLHDMPLSERNMVCDCGNVIDRDRNSAINIMKRFLSQNALWTGYQQFVGNLRQYRLPDGIEIHRIEAK
ncbi:transposase [uncultured Methanomethylovorans sp.]|uniref:RNA-guided endonuclease InsQ/TnpB family protein n=1 Tax=uncultured Methanomethylovorans sp. TaxID=183759 RepID=UPI002AA8347C|nr:transposase [uncultured Methanomethylovorans sp.]